MKSSIRRLAIAMLCAWTAWNAWIAIADDAPPPATTAETAPEPMAAFARLIGGEWHIGPLRHVFEWGIGKSSVVGRSYDDQGRLASEARWFFHPGEQVIRGYSVDTGGALFEMTTRFEGDELHNSLKTWAADGSVASYSARWVFTGEDSYDWTLHAETEDGSQQIMESSAVRRRAEPAE